MKTLFFIFVFFLSTALYSDWGTEQKLTASDGTEDDHFGNSVSIDGDYAVIGAIWDDDASGSAYIFHRNGTSWIEQTKLTASDGAPDDRFGSSVSISGDYAVIGAYGGDDILNNLGAAYIFHRSGTNWTQQAKISAYDGAEDDLFGWSVSIDGDYVVIGSVDDDDNGSASGSAYIFHRNGTTWTLQNKITASDGAPFDEFGNSVSISGDYAVIGALWDDDNGSGSGSAYIFHRSGTSWTEHVKITASDGEAEDWFGYSVSISGDYALIGAYGDDDNDSRSGSAYIFYRNGTNWTEQAKLLASDGELFDNFGYSTSISGDYAVIGAGFNGDNGAAYIFHRSGTTWTEQAKLTASDGAAEDWFGKSVSISGDYALIGAWQDDDNGAGSGSAYIYFNNVVFIEEEQMNLPVNTMLLGNYPNPFNPSTKFSYSIIQSGLVTLKVYDVLGTEIETLVDEEKPVGTYELTWNAEGLPSGIYFYRLQAGSFVETKKMVLLK